MAYIYHLEDGEILSVCQDNILTFNFPVKVTFISDLPTNVDYTFYRMADNGNLSENTDKMKEFQLSKITSIFENELATSKFMCSFGFEVDNRRSGIKNDKDNVTSLIKLGVPIVPFKGADGSITYLDTEQLKQLEIEMIQQGFSLYQKKWTLEAQINDGLTNSEISSIKW